ncbi:DUF3572 domain-containing protein [Sphingomonas jatrophae]|uniref:DUF3572 domain-containing protein n=1 Tax=Sphingomonas jatrophae TaxID=1166337 RepID=A0A1I6LMB9_9SPHN|nr:DUF3572 domain-containing protein [Sphingomonas jatrophae]SFS04559.1 Protein of unknown function [Sphingomonas jatrophae]
MPPHPTIDADGATVIALAALGWTLEDDDRATRLLSVTGLTPGDLRTRIGDPAVQAAVLAFLESHEPDLVACAEALRRSPDALVAAHRALDPIA